MVDLIFFFIETRLFPDKIFLATSIDGCAVFSDSEGNNQNFFVAIIELKTSTSASTECQEMLGLTNAQSLKEIIAKRFSGQTLEMICSKLWFGQSSIDLKCCTTARNTNSIGLISGREFTFN